MNNVVNMDGTPHVVAEFGSHGKRQQLETKMENLQRMLGARYEHIDKLLQQVDKIEGECNGLEIKYNKLLVDYGTRVGPENVDPKYLDFSTAIEFKMNDEGIIEMRVKLDSETLAKGNNDDAA